MILGYSLAEAGLLAAAGLVGLLLGEILERVVYPILPTRVIRFGQRLRWWYFYPFRWLLPDTIYKLWLQTGIMSPEAYRQFQEYGFIRDDLEPEYIAQIASGE